MKKFKFKFSTVLKVRKIAEDEALRVLGFCQQILQQELNKKSKLISEVNTAYQRLEKLDGHSTNISTYQAENEHIEGTKYRIFLADQAILRARKNMDKAKARFTAAKRQTQIMETLCEQARTEHHKELLKHEQKVMDDLTVMRLHQQKEEER